MFTLTVPDMTCKHCTSSIASRIKNIDANAQLNFDLSTRKVAVVSVASEAAIKSAIEAAGYTIAAENKGPGEARCCCT